MTEPTPTTTAELDEQPLRPDAGRTISRLQNRIGELVGQNEQLADVIEQLQERIRVEVAARVTAEQKLAGLDGATS